MAGIECFTQKMCTLASMTTNTIKGKHNYGADLTRSLRLHELCVYMYLKHLSNLLTHSIQHRPKITQILIQHDEIENRISRWIESKNYFRQSMSFLKLFYLQTLSKSFYANSLSKTSDFSRITTVQGGII